MSKRFLGLVCILYSLMFSYVVFFNKLKNFLAPQMHIYIKLSIIPLFYIGLVLIFNKKVSYKFKFSDLILLLPLLMLLFAGDGRLTSSFAQNRTMTYKSEKRVKVEETIEKKEEIKEETTKVTTTQKQEEIFIPDIEIIDANYNSLSQNITFDTDEYKQKFIGKKIRVKGFIMTDNQFLSSEFISIGKYGVSCCIADAEYTGFVLKYDKNKIKNNSWHEVEGILESGKDLEGYEILYIRVINIKEIDSKGEEMYAYPCYSYDDGECYAVQKYINN